MTPIQKTKMSNFRWVICALLFLATTIKTDKKRPDGLSS